MARLMKEEPEGQETTSMTSPNQHQLQESQARQEPRAKYLPYPYAAGLRLGLASSLSACAAQAGELGRGQETPTTIFSGPAPSLESRGRSVARARTEASAKAPPPTPS